MNLREFLAYYATKPFTRVNFSVKLPLETNIRPLRNETQKTMAK